MFNYTNRPRRKTLVLVLGKEYNLTSRDPIREDVWKALAEELDPDALTRGEFPMSSSCFGTVVRRHKSPLRCDQCVRVANVLG